MKKYVCTAGFAVDQFDDDGFSTGKWSQVEEGDVWIEEETTFRMVGGDDTVRLHKEGNPVQWLEITQDRLNDCFLLAENT